MTTNNLLSQLAQQNVDTVRAWVEAINHNDIAAEIACWQPGGEFYIVPTGTTYQGIEEIRRAGQKSASVIGGQPILGRKQITHLEAGEEWAVVEYDTRADIRGPIVIQNQTLLPEGEVRTLVSKACVVFQMKQGKLQNGREYFDTLSMAEQLGLDRAALEKMYATMASQDDLTKE